MNPVGYKARVNLMRQLNARASGNGSELRLPEIPKHRGIMLVRPEGFAALDEAIAEAKRDFAGYVPGDQQARV